MLILTENLIQLLSTTGGALLTLLAVILAINIVVWWSYRR